MFLPIHIWRLGSVQAPLLHQKNSLSGSHPEAQGPARLPSVLASFFPQKNDGEENLRWFCFCSSHNRRWLCWQPLREGSGVFRHAPVLPPVSCKREVYCSSHWSHLPQMSSDLLRSPEVCNLLICLVSFKINLEAYSIHTRIEPFIGKLLGTAISNTDFPCLELCWSVWGEGASHLLYISRLPQT